MNKLITKFKELLKRILPPPTRSFMREVNRLMDGINRNNRAINAWKVEQRNNVSKQMDAIYKSKEEQLNVLAQGQEQQKAEFARQADAMNRMSLELNRHQEGFDEFLVLAKGQATLVQQQAESLGTISEAANQQTEIAKRLASVVREYARSVSGTKAEIATQAISLEHLTEIVKEQSRQIAALLTIVEQQNGQLAALQRADEQRKLDLSELKKNLIERMNRIERSVWRNFTYDYIESLTPEQYEEALKIWYRQRTAEELNLDNPLTYNEKIQWLKLYDATPLKTRLADKYLVRDWVKEKIGEEYLIPLLGVWDSFDEIDFDALPNSFVLKANHGCGWNIIVKDKNTFDKEDARKKIGHWMNQNYAFYGFEPHYLNISPKIIAEEYMENNHLALNDYKVYCFNGEAKFVGFFSERNTGLKSAFYDKQWEKMDISIGSDDNKVTEKPDNLALLLELAEKLSEGFAHVRVDFYVLYDGSIKFGEMTFSPANGTNRWMPLSWNRTLGDMIQLPEKCVVPRLER